jgi:hypothetical protein
MAAAIKAINAKIRSNKVLDYFCSTRTFPPPDHCWTGVLRARELRANEANALESNVRVRAMHDCAIGAVVEEKEEEEYTNATDSGG